MGASKRIAELVMLAPRAASARMKAVRLGNVLGSEGSIVPLFLKQILVRSAGNRHASRRSPLLPHHRRCGNPTAARGFSGDSARHTGAGVGRARAGGTLAQHLMDRPGRVPIVFTQLRPGDKMCEALLSDRESYLTHADAQPAAASGQESLYLRAGFWMRFCDNSSRPAGNARWNGY